MRPLTRPSTSTDNYAVYLSIKDANSDFLSEDEELTQAIMASLESQVAPEHLNTKSAQEVHLGLESQIDNSQRCRFNINRSSVLDGALRGFRRLSYSPMYQMCMKFSDDLGMDEDAVDLGGPRREFLRLLIEALALSPMFEGRDGKLNLALDSSDRYFVAGLSIAVSLVHGGPPPGFLSPTLYFRLVGSDSLSKPVLEDIVDAGLFEKVKKNNAICGFLCHVSGVRLYSFNELLHTTEPLQDYLANVGCLRPLKSIEDRDLLVEDILVFQVVHRVSGAFESCLWWEATREGLKSVLFHFGGITCRMLKSKQDRKSLVKSWPLQQGQVLSLQLASLMNHQLISCMISPSTPDVLCLQQTPVSTVLNYHCLKHMMILSTVWTLNKITHRDLAENNVGDSLICSIPSTGTITIIAHHMYFKILTTIDKECGHCKSVCVLRGGDGGLVQSGQGVADNVSHAIAEF